MKEKRELITEKTFVLLDAQVYDGPLGNSAVFVMTAEKPIDKPISRRQMLEWAAELASRMYIDDSK